jgi:hypothetical protein
LWAAVIPASATGSPAAAARGLGGGDVGLVAAGCGEAVTPLDVDVNGSTQPALASARSGSTAANTRRLVGMAAVSPNRPAGRKAGEETLAGRSRANRGVRQADRARVSR